MKILEWKSFAIGVLLTTTVVLGTGASNKPTNKNLLEKIEILSWDKNQQWEFKTSNTKNIPLIWTNYQIRDRWTRDLQPSSTN